jgi:prepilin-type N-terminal cleavage/methylation domain-containing protein
MQSRAGITLLEVLIVMAIFALIVGLLLPGIQKTRESAARINGSNNIKQITLAMQQYTDEHEDCLPLGNGYKSTFYFILPWLEHGNYYNAVETGARPYSNDYEMILYISPIDPTLSNPEVRNGKASYAYNALVYVPEIRKDLKATSTNTFLDGTSNTIVLTEHYAFNCDGTQFDWMWAKPARTLDLK